jgi:Fe-S cluster assembly protein SufD
MTIPINVEMLNEANLLLDRDAFLTGLLSQVTTNKNDGWLHNLRDGAISWVRHSLIPNTRDEEWRFTDLSPLKEVNFQLGLFEEASLNLEDHILSDVSHRLTFVNGVFAANLSAVTNLG